MTARTGGTLPPMPPLSPIPPVRPSAGNGHAARVAEEERRSIPALLGSLLEETRQLLLQEVRLARAETRQTLELVGANLLRVAIGGALALGAVLILVVALDRGLTVALAQWIDLEVAAWLSPLLLGLVLAAVGGTLLSRGIRTIKRQSLAPEKTLESLKEQTAWIREKTRQ